MRRVVAGCALTAVLALPHLGAAAPPEPRSPTRWEADVRVAHVALGDERPTGGVMPLAAARHVWTVTPWLDLGVGAELGLFGFGAGTHWIGVLGGVTINASVRPAAPVTFGVEVQADGGRIPVCTDYGLCVRYIGFFPAVALEGAWYATRILAVAARVSIRDVNTLAWYGPSIEPSIAGRLYW